MQLTLSNYRTDSSRWQRYVLQPANRSIKETNKVVFETDQIKFSLSCPANIVSAKLFIGDAELHGKMIVSGEGSRFEWKPKINKRFGHDAFFLHYCGIANLSILTWNDEGISQRVLFESVNVCGRKITAERVGNMLTYISTNITEDLLQVFSPTQFDANLVKKGVSLAENLQRLEVTLQQVSTSLKGVISRPLSSLRPTLRTLKYPSPEQLQSCDMEWVLENAGLAVEADSAETALFHSGFRWRAMAEIASTAPADSTDIQENHLIRFYLITLQQNANELVNQSRLSEEETSNDPISDDGEVYLNFYSIANRLLNKLGAGYYQRAEECLNHCNHLLTLFDKHIPTRSLSPNTLRITEKMRTNRHYHGMAKLMHDWMEKREVVWLEKVILSSINSTWKLFEYYCVMVTNNFLFSEGISSNKGLFSGGFRGRQLSLSFEPRWPTANKAGPNDSIIIVDRYTNNYREPDIVIDIQATKTQPQKILVFDAKCRGEQDVWKDLQKCELKYTLGVRDLDGKCPVRSLIMLYPAPSSASDINFQDYYLAPFNLQGPKSAEPVMGIQRLNILDNGCEKGLDDFLSLLFRKYLGDSFLKEVHPSYESSPYLRVV